MITEINKIESSDFLLAIKREGEVELAIDNVSDIKKSKFDNNYYFYIDYKILSNLIYQENDLKGTVVGLPYNLNEDKGNDGHFKISENQKIFPILQYGINKNGYNIHNSFRCNENDIKENLEGLEFKGKVRTKNNYEMIIPIK